MVTTAAPVHAKAAVARTAVRAALDNKTQELCPGQGASAQAGAQKAGINNQLAQLQPDVINCLQRLIGQEVGSAVLPHHALLLGLQPALHRQQGGRLAYKCRTAFDCSISWGTTHSLVLVCQTWPS